MNPKKYPSHKIQKLNETIKNINENNKGADYQNKHDKSNHFLKENKNKVKFFFNCCRHILTLILLQHLKKKSKFNSNISINIYSLKDKNKSTKSKIWTF